MTTAVNDTREHRRRQRERRRRRGTGSGSADDANSPHGADDLSRGEQ